MKKIIKKLDNLLYEYGWFAIFVMVLSAVTLILLISSVVTPFINSVVWGTCV